MTAGAQLSPRLGQRKTVNNWSGRYKYVASGEVTLDKTNVACKGREMKAQGKRHETILDLVTVSFKMVKV